MTIVFRKIQIGKDKLRDIILKNPECVQPGLSFIDLNFGNDDEGVIDFLGVDQAGRLIIVNFEVNESDKLLILSLSQMHWLKKNKSLIQRLFINENVDFSCAPIIMLISPMFSPRTIAAAKQLLEQEITLLKYQYIIAGTEDAIFFEAILNIRQSESIKDIQVQENVIAGAEEEPIKSALPKKETVVSQKKNKIELTPEEIAEFKDFDRVLEIEKSSNA